MNRVNKIGLSALMFYLCGTVFLLLTNPQHLSPVLLIVPFLIFFVALFLTVIYGGMVCSGQNRFSKKGAMIAAMIAGSPILLLLLQSIGQLSFRDILTLVLLLGVSGFYIVRAQFSS